MAVSACSTQQTVVKDKMGFFPPKNGDIFHISQWKHFLWYSLEASQWDASNEYPQQMFSLRNKRTGNLDISLVYRALATPI